MARRRFPGGRLVGATHNPGKLRELKELFAPFTTGLVSAGELGLAEPEETETTFAGNAELKARAAAVAAGACALADDSGLVVPALKGDPGVYSARYAGLNATDADNRKKLLENMQGLEGDARTAFYECCLEWWRFIQ